MRLKTLVFLLLATAGLAACGGPATPNVAQPTATSALPTSSPTPFVPVAEEVTFSTEDGVKLAGTFYKGSSTAVVMSHMSGGSRADWRDVPELLAERGYTVLAFDFRGRGASEGGYDPPASNVDLLAAVDYVKSRGADRLVLAGASMGAMASAKVAAASQADAVVLVAGTTSWSGLEVLDTELAAIKAPLLVISSEGDGYIDGTLHFYDAAGGPKEKHIYQGAAHGTDLMDEYGEDFRERIISFMMANVPVE